jgi:hypothetical protein
MPNLSAPDSTIFNIDIPVLNNFIQQPCGKVSFVGGARRSLLQYEGVQSG